jgi:ferredoxin, 2Fe-2S
MLSLLVIDRDKPEREIEGEAGMSVMEVLREGGCDDVEAVCGGCCSCATCHVYVDPEFADRLPPISKDEAGMLEGLTHRTAQSRLSCQLPFSAALAGIRVTVAPEE